MILLCQVSFLMWNFPLLIYSPPSQDAMSLQEVLHTELYDGFQFFHNEHWTLVAWRRRRRRRLWQSRLRRLMWHSHAHIVDTWNNEIENENECAMEPVNKYSLNVFARAIHICNYIDFNFFTHMTWPINVWTTITFTFISPKTIQMILHATRCIERFR